MVQSGELMMCGIEYFTVIRRASERERGRERRAIAGTCIGVVNSWVGSRGIELIDWVL